MYDLKLDDLTPKEVDIIWGSLDADKSGEVDYGEFCRKLERHGVRSRTKEEIIIYQIIEAVERSPAVKSMSDLFAIIDKKGDGIISREDFRGMFQSLPNLKLDEKELENFMDYFWRDNKVGIDYRGFYRFFSKF